MLELSLLSQKTRSSVLRKQKRVRKSRLNVRSNLVEEKVTKPLLDLQILYLLRSEPQTLYSMKKSLSETFGTERSFGTIHPHLVKLEENGLIESREEKKGPNARSGRLHRRIYRLTVKGRSNLHKDVELLSRLVLTMTA